MKAIIPAAGMGTRFLPATKAQPKEMLPVLDKPTIQYVVEEALVAGADEVLLVTNDDKPSIKAHFSANPKLVKHLVSAGKPEFAKAVEHAGSMPVGYVDQSEALGLGHAVLCAAERVTEANPPEAFYVLLGDVLVPDNEMLPRMKAISEAHGDASVIAVIPVSEDQVSRFGIIAGKSLEASDTSLQTSEPDVWKVEALVEKPAVEDAPSNLAIFGRYLLSPTVMEILKTTKPGAGGEIQLTDALIGLLANEEIYALVIDPEKGYDVGTIPDWLKTNLRMAERLAASSPELKGLLREF
jgi:UTP--glucose-1-phosphate uridylyltransferase